LAIFKRQADTGEQAGQPAEASGSLAVDESMPEAQPVSAVTPEAVIGSPQPPRDLPAALEPELRRIIDTAVARVAAIELEAIREARQLSQRSEHEARDALRFALDRGLNLISSLELLAATINGMADALKTELDDAIVALRNVSEPQSELAEQLMQQPPPPIEEEAETNAPVPDAPAAEEPVMEQPAAEQPPAEQPAAEQPAAEQPATEGPAPEPAAQEPAPESQPEAPPEAETPAEPRVRLTPLVRPAAPAPEQEPAEAEAEAPSPEKELVTVGAPAERSPDRRARLRRFFTR
jgi:hypothetical protein